MSRRTFLQKAGLGIAASAAVAPANAQQSPTISWRMTSSFPKSVDTLWNTAEFIARRVAEVTEGRFQIRVFGPGEVVPALQALDAVQAGTVECAHTAPYYFVGKDPAFAFGTALPFGMNSRMQSAWQYYGGGNEALALLYKDYGVIGMPAGNTGAQMAGWFRKEIKTVADLKGLKFRVGTAIAGQVLAKVGVIGQSIAGGEVYQALERGTLDATEFVGPYDDEKLGFYKVAKYYYYPGWWEGGAELALFVGEKKWAELPKHYQSALEAACAEAKLHMQARYDAVNPAALRRLVANGVQLRAFPHSTPARSAGAASPRSGTTASTWSDRTSRTTAWSATASPWPRAPPWAAMSRWRISCSWAVWRRCISSAASGAMPSSAAWRP